MAGGSPNVPTTQTVIQQQDLPQWYQQYLQQLIPAAQSAAATPYQAYGGQRIAPLTTDQQNAQTGIENLQGAAQPLLNQAGADITGATASAQPDFTGAAQNFGAAGNTNVVGAGLPLVGAGAQDISQAGQQASQGGGAAAAQPYLNASLMQSGLGAAQPYLNNASQSLPDATQANVSPYLNGALQSLANQSNLQLQQQILPSVANSFISAGQFGSTRDQDATTQAINNQEQTLQNAQAGLLNTGYQNAGQLAESNLGLQGQLGATAGALGSQQQQAIQNAGTTLGGLTNSNIGQLTSAGQGLGQLGQGLSSAAAQQGQLQLGAGQGLAALGSTQGQLGLQAATDQAALAQQQQTMGIQANAALQSVGQQQQTQEQSNLDTAYQDFQNQVNYPWTQLGNLSNIIHGLPVNTSQSTTSTAPATTSQLQPSPLGQLAGAGAAIAGVASAAKGGAIKKRRVVYKARGGKISDKPGRNASYGHIERSGLGFAMGMR